MSKGKARILVVDDEARYVWAIRANLEERGFGVLTAGDGQAAVDLAAAEHPDLILLDVRMPGMDGYEACRRIREFSTVPIIMLTALAEEGNKVAGLDAGADDYVTKPFGAKELMARVRASLRRTEYDDGPEPVPRFEAGLLVVDYAEQRVFLRGEELHLTPIEYGLLRELVQNAGRVLVPDYLLERVWGPGCAGETRMLRQAVHRLRKKIEQNPAEPRYIQTRIGLGYTFVP